MHALPLQRVRTWEGPTGAGGRRMVCVRQDIICIYVNAHICSIKHTHTHTHTREDHDTHCSRAFCGTIRRLVSVPTLQLLQVVQTRLERGGGGGGK